MSFDTISTRCRTPGSLGMLVFALVCHVSMSLNFTQADDVFELHTSRWLRKGIEKQKPLSQISLKEAGRLKSLSPDLSSHCLVIKTNDGNLTKALVAWGFRRGPEKLIPVLLIERYVTYRGENGNVSVATGKDVMLFAGFAFNFDIGQVVPEGQGGDVRFTEKSVIEPIGKAQLFGINGSQLPAPKKGATGNPLDHDGVLPRDFAGIWNISVDGRWEGTMRLTVERNGRVTGTYTSKNSKSTYKVTGRVAALPHNLKLRIMLDNTTQTVDAFLYTESKSKMTGTATLAGRKFGFHATRPKKKPAKSSP
ncbi:MAG: hypothetical protein Tsb009_27000 [Planctomycetaceae bacterium]